MASVASLTAGLSPEQLLLLKDQNHDTQVYTYAVVFTVLTIIAVVVRVTSRHMKNVAVGIDDVLIILALVITTAQTIFICVGVRDYGLGRHLWALTPEQVVGFEKLWYTVGTLQCTALMLTKISLLMLFHRIFIVPAFRTATKVIGVTMILWWIGTILADCLICIPIKHNWNPEIPARCGNKQLLAIIPPIPWIVTDLAILLMPMPMVYKLHLPGFQRVGLAGLFLLGSFALVSSCVRYSTLFYQRDDVTYYLIPATIWTIIESDVTIISTCLIVSRPWFIKLYPSKLVSLIKDMASKRSSKGSSGRSDGRRGLFSTFARLSDTPPAVDVSRGAPFEMDIEKNQDLEKNQNIDSSLPTNCQRMVTVRGGMEGF